MKKKKLLGPCFKLKEGGFNSPTMSSLLRRLEHVD